VRLYCSGNSPYARKVRAVAIELRLESKIDLLDTNLRDGGTGFWDINPLGKIPVLETDDGLTLYDSPVICEYLTASFDGHRLLSAPGQNIWQVRTVAALADGTMDAAMLVRLELQRPENERSPADMAKQMATVARGFDRLQALLADRDDRPDLGTIGAACCVSWVMYRHPGTDWLGPRPGLSAWYQRMAARASLQRTAPGLVLAWE
jgi:glutathione S-transferase